MEILINTGMFFALAICSLLFVRHGLNVLRSFGFVVNALFLFTYYLPAVLLQMPLSYKAAGLILAGHLSMNLGVLAGVLLCPALFSGKRPLWAGSAEKIPFPSGKLLVLLFAAGVLGYSFLYAVKGVPLLSEDADLARDAFVSGAGMVVWPASILINASVWLLALRGSNKTALALGVAGIACIALSGWRGQIIFMVLSLLFSLSYKNGISKKTALIGLAGIMGIAVLGIIRSNLGGHALYGLELSGGFDLETLGSVGSLGWLYILNRLGEHALNFNAAVSHFFANPLGGAGMLMDFLFLMPGKNETTASYMKDMFGEWEGGGGMPITMLGGFFADFGTPGVLFLPFLAAFVQVVSVKAFLNMASRNKVFLVPPGVMANFWVFGFLGTYFRDFLPLVLIYLFGFSGIIFFCRFLMTAKKMSFAGTDINEGR